MVQYPRKMKTLTTPLKKPKYSHRPNLFGVACTNICTQEVKLACSNGPDKLGSLLRPFHLKTKADPAFEMHLFFWPEVMDPVQNFSHEYDF
jgi:hypothetical protein